MKKRGALLLAPACDEPDETIGYITRYAPGLRENGGVYTHAATRAIAAAKMRDADFVGRLLTAINPTNKDSERYWAEPYVLPGDVDGSDSPYPGRAGWSWYSGSAAWLPRVISKGGPGSPPHLEGLRFDPCLPPGWNRASLRRPWRGAQLHIDIERAPGLAAGEVEVAVDNRPLAGDVLTAVCAGAEMRVRVRCG